MKIPGYKSVRQFAIANNINYGTVIDQMKRGYCKWPRFIKDGKTEHPLYPIYDGMKQRCYNPNNRKYHLYGGKGIQMSVSWLDSFWNFVRDMGDRPYGASIERLDGNKGYNKQNCVWASPRQQARNTDTYRNNIRTGKKQGTFRASLRVKGHRLYTPTTDSIEQAELDLQQLELLYEEYL